MTDSTRSLLYPEEGMRNLEKGTMDAIGKFFPYEGKNQRLELTKIYMDNDADPDDIASQKRARMRGRTWASGVLVDMKLVDKTSGKVVDQVSGMKILNLPRITRRYSFIVDGTEYQADNQWRLKSGVYSRKRNNGELTAQVNLAKGRGFNLDFFPERGQMLMRYHTTNIQLIPVLRAMGMSEQQLSDSLGSQVYSKLSTVRDRGDTLKLARALDPKFTGTTDKEAVAAIRTKYAETSLREDTTAITLGKPYSKVSEELLLATATKLININRGTAEVDPRDSLQFKELWTVDDHIPERIANSKARVLSKLRNNIDRKQSIRDVIPADTFNVPVKAFFTSTSLAQQTTQVNPVDMLGGYLRTTIMGTGGIGSEQAVGIDAKMIEPSSLGIVDPVHTPEGCFDPETEVFTDRGWVLWPNVTPETRFACRVDGRLEFHCAAELHAYDFHGELLGLRKPWLEYLVTPNHRMWCRPEDRRTPNAGKYRFETAQQMHGKMRVFNISHAPAQGVAQEDVRIPLVPESRSISYEKFGLDDWAEFLGWYLSEGSCTAQQRNVAETKQYSVYIHQSLKSGDNCARIEALLTHLGLRWNSTLRENDRVVYTVTSRQLTEYVGQFGYSHERYLPDEVHLWPVAARARLLESLLLGDGRQCASHRAERQASETYTTTSHALAVGVERLAISLGWATTFKKFEDKREERYLDVYEICLLRHKERSSQTSSRTRHSPYYTVPYTGKVYCASVPGELLYVRRGGKHPLWLGNSKSGISTHLTLGVSKRGNEAVIAVIDRKTGKEIYMSPAEMAGKSIGFADQFTRSKNGGLVGRGPTASAIPRAGGDPTVLPSDQVDLVLRSPKSMFSATANLIPFLPADSAGRAGMATRHMEQAVALKYREEPLVQVASGADDPRHDTFEKMYGRFTSHAAPVAGTVTEVTKDAVTVKDAAGKKHVVSLYDNFPLNDGKAFIHSTPIVKVGDTLSAGDIVADTNFTKNGVLSIGKNMTVAYLPFRGLVFEDGIVVSEEAAKKLTSEHMHKPRVYLDRGMSTGLAKFRSQFPGVIDEKNAEKLDADGVIKPGMEVAPGDVIMAVLKKNEPSPEQVMLKGIHKALARPYKNSAVVWDGHTKGVVTDVARNGSEIVVHVRTEEPVEVGDKLCFDAETEVLTERGWLPVADVTTQDRVCSLVDGEIAYQCPSETFQYTHGDRMYRVKSQQVDLFVTAQHRMWVQQRDKPDFGLYPAEDIFGRRVSYAKSGTWVGTRQETFTFPALTVDAGQGGVGTRAIPAVTWSMDAFLTVLGAYISEGNLLNIPGSGSYGLEISQCKEPNRAELQAALDALGVAYTVVANGNKVRIHSKQVMTWFAQLGKAHDKHIPGWVFSLAKEQLQILFKWLMWGDGHSKNGRPICYTTVSRQLADDVQRLCLHIGYAANIRPRHTPARWIVDHVAKASSGFSVQIVTTKLTPTVNHGHVKTQSVQVEEFVEDYKGRVFCVTVPGHVLYVRRNGTPVWSGNSARHGNKGVISAVLPMEEMPRNAAGETVDIIVNPSGVPGRINVGQVLETMLGKVADKTGQTYAIDNFQPDSRKKIIMVRGHYRSVKGAEGVEKKVWVDAHTREVGYQEIITEALKQNGLSETEELFDPTTGKSFGQVLVGKQYFIKLMHQVQKKLAARSHGYGNEYDANLAPKGGGDSGAQRFGELGLYAMLAHGSTANIREAMSYKSDKSQADVWNAIQAGEPLPAPKTSFAYEKFVAYLNAAGINVEKEGNELRLIPYTDREIRKRSNGELKNPQRVIRGKDLRAEPGGLFDEKITGGPGGKNWAHIELAERIPNPVFSKAILTLLGLTNSRFDAILAGTEKLDGKTGPDAIAAALDKIDVDRGLAAAKQELKTARKSALSNAYKRVKYLQALKNADLTAKDAYTLSAVPVIPPIFRPITAMEGGDLNVDGINLLYRDLALINEKLAEGKKVLPASMLAPLRTGTYQALEALVGTGAKATGMSPTGDVKPPGILAMLSGNSPKTSFVHEKLIGRKQDLTMRSVIIPDMTLGLDEIGLPREGAYEIYRPFIVKELVKMGYTPLQARDEITKRTSLASKALDVASAQRPVLFKRDPVLHKFGIMGFNVRLHDGAAIQIHPLVTGGFNADFNGDSCPPWVQVPVRIEKVVHLTTFGELATMLMPGASEDDQLRLAEGGTAVLELKAGGVEVLSWIPGTGITWAPAKQFTVHSSHGPCFCVETHIGRSVEVSEHHNFSIIGEDLHAIGTKTDHLEVGQLVPFIKELPAPHGEPAPSFVDLGTVRFNLTRDAGWFFGYYVGDGCITGRNDTVSMACGDDALHPYIASICTKLGFRPWDEPGRSVRVTNSSLAVAMKEAFGHRAENKSIPGWVLSAPEDFRAGFIAGFIDAEANVDDKNPTSVSVRIESTSRRLLEDFALILATFKVGAYIQPAKAATERTQATCVLRTVAIDMRKLPLAEFPKKRAAMLAALGVVRTLERSEYDLVPFSTALADYFLKIPLAEKRLHKREDTDRVPVRAKEIHKYGAAGYVTRSFALRLLDKYGAHHTTELFQRWLGYVRDTSTGWTYITKVEERPRPKLMYDFSVPEGHETFSVAGGLITHNTMSVFVPVTQQSVDEVNKMKPSNNLFNLTTGTAMYQPTLEGQLGLYLMTHMGKETKNSYPSAKEAIAAAADGKIDATDVITVGGKRTTVGRLKVHAALPEEVRTDAMLTDPTFVLGKSNLQKVLVDVGKKTPNEFSRTIDKIKDVGFGYSHDTGFSFTIDDFKALTAIREKHLSIADKKIAALDAKLSQEERDKRAVEIFTEATKNMSAEAKVSLAQTGSKLYAMNKAGVKPSWEQVQQMVLAPMLMENAAGRVIPSPIRRSYSEGLDSAGYWTASSGARKGVVDKVLAVQKPGALSKQIINTVVPYSVTMNDCGTTRGQLLDVDDGELADRYLAKDVVAGGTTFKAGTLLAPNVTDKLKQARVTKVLSRSPLKCQAPHGMCAKCYGIADDGKDLPIGTNIGVIAGQSIGERGTQLSLKAFHTGGVAGAGSKVSSNLDRVIELLKMPETLPDAARLSTATGKVTAITKSPLGGYEVRVGDTAHYTPGDRALRVAKGDEVARGDALTDGAIDPRKLMELTSIDNVQRYMTDELYGAYKSEGVKRRNAEVVIKAMTNHGVVEDAGDSDEFVRGDPVSLTYAEHAASNSGLKNPVKVTPVLRGLETLPLDRTTDWGARLQYRHLRETLQRGAAEGWTSDIHGSSPIPGIIYTAEFGKPDEKAKGPY